MSDVAMVIRDWLHETPLSLCSMAADECPDWALAHALAEAIAERDGPLAGPAWDRLIDVTTRQVEGAGVRAGEG
jgi:hypothetical protein